MTQLIAAVILLAPGLPLFLLLRVAGFRRRLVVFPSLLYKLSIFLISYVALVGVAVIFFQGILPGLALISVLIGLYLHLWRARADYGVDRGLPPGKLKIAPTGPWANESYYQQQFVHYGDLFKTSHFVQPMVCIRGIDSSLRFLREHQAALVTPPLPFHTNIPQGYIRFLPADTYADYRAGFMAAFGSRRVLEPRTAQIRAIFDHALARSVAQTSQVSPAELLHEATREAMLLLFLGLTRTDERYGRTDQLLLNLDWRETLSTRRARSEAYLNEFEQIISSCLVDADACFIAELLQTEQLGDKLAKRDSSLQRNLVYLMLTVSIDVADMLVWLWYDLTQASAWVSKVREIPEAAAERASDNTLASRIVLETLRLHQSEYLMRRTTADISFDGFRIPSNWYVRIGIHESHRDSKIFANADQFDPDRFLDRNRIQACYAPFGLSSEACLGRQVAMSIGIQFLRSLVTEYRWHTLSDGPPELGAFHWRPASNWRVQKIA